MFARITPYKMKAGSREATTALVEQLKDQIMALNGMHQFINVINDSESGYVISISESKEISDGNAEQVRAIWGAFSEYLDSVPQPEGYDVMANWKI